MRGSAAVSLGWGTGEESHGEAGVIKSTLLGALFTLPYGDPKIEWEKMYVFKN